MIAGYNFSNIFFFPVHPIQRIFPFLIFLVILTNCAPKYISHPPQDFSQAIARIEKLIPEEQNPSRRARYHLQLTWLYSNFKNPKMDYRKALEELEIFISLAPEEAQADEIQNWLSILRAFERSEKERWKIQERLEVLARENLESRSALEDQIKKNLLLLDSSTKLLEKNTGLEGINATLKENNATLKRAIEKLKTLNLQVEKKRKSVK